MYEYPPILQGTEQEQLRALRDYLVRMTRSLQAAETAALEPAAPAASASAAVPAAGDAAQARHTAGELRSLITKTARRLRESLDGEIDAVQQNLDRLDGSLREDYLAVSDFGAYTLQAELNMSATARQVVESYALDERIDALGRDLEDLDSTMTALRGEIRRGLITDPETGETALGIAIAESLSFTGATHTADGLVYYELSPGQTLGLYTAAGWQFWINGAKRGWFDSADGMLHVTNIVSENRFQLGGRWEITDAGGFGIKYIGG